MGECLVLIVTKQYLCASLHFKTRNYYFLFTDRFMTINNNFEGVGGRPYWIRTRTNNVYIIFERSRFALYAAFDNFYMCGSGNR